MKNIIILLALTLISCNATKTLSETDKAYKKFIGFEPVDPTEYTDQVSVVSGSEIVKKDIKLLSKEAILDFLNNETVLVSIGEVQLDGKLSYLPVTISAKNTSYKITMDYMKYATLGVKNKNDQFIGFKRVGVGLRLTSLVTTKTAGINIGDLTSIGAAANSKKLTGTMMIEVVGIKSKEITTILPLPSEISQSSIQSAMLALGNIKAKIYDSETVLFPQVMAIQDFISEDAIQRNQAEEETEKENKILLQFGKDK